jgi:two-component system, sensor histidine kinase
MNLISNAVKFTFRGAITLSVSQTVQNQKQFIVFSVKDTGIGIKDQDKSKLFTLFGMISDARKINQNGTGIGLTICQKYVQKLEGEISLSSEFERGTIVTFTIPLENHDNRVINRRL